MRRLMVTMLLVAACTNKQATAPDGGISAAEAKCGPMPSAVLIKPLPTSVTYDGAPCLLVWQRDWDSTMEYQSALHDWAACAAAR